MSSLPYWILLEGNAADDTEKVVAGMELGAWQPTPSQWAAWLAVQERRYRADLAKPILWILGLVGIGVGAALGALVVSEELAVGTAGAFALLAAVSVVRVFRVYRRSAQLARMVAGSPPRIVVTSTGILFGDLARAWRGDDSRLDHVGFNPDGPYLVVHFQSRKRVAEYTVPMLVDATVHASTIVGELNRFAARPPE